MISIIIPCRNAAEWLGDTLNSVFAQTWKDFEVLVVDDQSTDDSRRLMQNIDDPRLKIVDGPGMNASAARNAGLEQASGQWIQFLDADDMLHPEKLQIQMELAHNHPEYLLFSGEWARFRKEPREAIFRPEPVWKDLSGLEFLRLHFQEGWMFQPGVWLTHRSLIDKAGSWNEALTLNDDGEFFCRVMLTAGSIQFCEGARVYYRSHATGSLSGDKSEEAMTSLYESYRLTFEHMLNVDSTPETREAVADGWRWLALELFEYAPGLSVEAEARALEYGGSRRPLPGGRLFKCLQPLFGWRTAKWMEKKVRKGLFRKPSQ